MKYTAPRGTKDILPSETRSWQWIEQAFADVCRRFSYREIRIPTFESTELFQRGVGEGTDVVQKEMYTFTDRSGRSLTLRPEGTAGVMRSFVENGLSSEPSPVKLYYNISAFRYEKMQKGRYREFHQLGCECLGSDSAWADAELISLFDTFLKELGLQNISLKINSIGCPACRPAYREELKAYFRPKLAEMCEDCRKRYDLNPLRLLDCKQERCSAIAKDAPIQLDYLCPDCQEHWREVTSTLDGMGVRYEVDPMIVRGLDYYTRTVFEFVSENVGTQGTICGGGRYDGLIEEIGGPPTAGVGFAFGVERLLLEMEGRKMELPGYEPPTLFIAAFPEFARDGALLCYRLRQAGIHADADVVGRSMKAQLKYANRIKAEYLFVLGQEEVERNYGKIKRMSDGHEKETSFEGLVEFFMKSNLEREEIFNG